MFIGNMADAPCIVNAGDMNCYNYNCSGPLLMQIGVFQREESVRIVLYCMKS